MVNKNQVVPLPGRSIDIIHGPDLTWLENTQLHFTCSANVTHYFYLGIKLNKNGFRPQTSSNSSSLQLEHPRDQQHDFHAPQ